MRIEELRKKMHRQPFQPFTIRMVDGRAFDVPHPDFIAVSKSGRSIVVFQDDGHSVLDLALVSEFEVHDPDERAA